MLLIFKLALVKSTFYNHCVSFQLKYDFLIVAAGLQLRYDMV